MMKKEAVFILLLTGMLVCATDIRSVPSEKGDDFAQFDANNIQNSMTNSGHISFSLEGGIIWRGVTVSWVNGVWLIGKGNTTGNLYSAAANYSSEWSPGKILSSGDADDPGLLRYRVYSIDRNYSEGDYSSWPVEDGAPVDENGDPLLIGDQTVWYVVNDMVAANHSNEWDTAPMGVEAQFTFFGVDSVSGLDNVMFVKILFIFKNIPESMDSVFVGLWNDFDLGNPRDDLLGVDTLLTMSYCYNGSDTDYYFGSRIPAIGIQLLQGPMIESPGDTAIFIGRHIPDRKNLPLTSHLYYFHDRYNGVPPTVESAWLNIKGLNTNGEPFYNPARSGEPTPFCFSGDPATGTGWLNDDPSEYRSLMGIGPFAVKANQDSQELILAVLVGPSINQYSGIQSLRAYATLTENVYHNNFTDFRQKVNLIYNEEKIAFNESGFQTELLVQMEDNADINDYQSSMYYRLDRESAFHRKTLENSDMLPPLGTEGDYLSANLADDGGFHQIQYYFELDGSGGEIYTYPIAAPAVWFESIYGPDNVPPVLSGSLDILKMALWSGTRLFSGSFSYSDRFPCGRVIFQTSMNGAAWTDFPATFYEDYSIRWQSQVQWNGMTQGDTIYCRLAVADSSENQNTAYLDTVLMIFTTKEDIGNFGEMYFDNASDELADWEIKGWKIFSENPSLPGIVMMPDTSVSESLTDGMTLSFQPAIHLKDYQSADLLTDQRLLIQPEDTAFVEYSTTSQVWHPIVIFTDTSNTAETEWSLLNLKPFLEMTDIYLRFRFVRHANAASQWDISTIRLIIDSTFTREGSDNLLPERFIVRPAYPNPFNPATTLSYDLPEARDVRLSIYNIRGQQVFEKSWINQSPGIKEFVWNADNLASGIYFMRLDSGQEQYVRKVILQK